MTHLLFAVIIFACLMRGCCSETTRIEPNYPSEVSGWQESHERGLKIVGKFVLRKGETIQNEQFRIKLIEVTSGDPCVDAGDERHEPRVTLQFVRVRDGKTLCEDRFGEKGSRTFSGTQCQSNLSEFGVMGIYVIAVNVRDGWVFFELRG